MCTVHCGSGYARIGIIFPNLDRDRPLGLAAPEPDSDPYPNQPEVKLDYTFSSKFQYTV
jgi:hypothetical protein